MESFFREWEAGIAFEILLMEFNRWGTVWMWRELIDPYASVERKVGEEKGILAAGEI